MDHDNLWCGTITVAMMGRIHRHRDDTPGVCVAQSNYYMAP